MESFKSNILVIDDDEGIRSLLKQFLNENGYLVNTASNASEAQEKILIIKFFTIFFFKLTIKFFNEILSKYMFALLTTILSISKISFRFSNPFRCHFSSSHCTCRWCWFFNHRSRSRH